MAQLPSVVIVGRSNVGKSTLFNAIAEKQIALVLPEAGTTRDTLDAKVSWRDKTFFIVDTGGLDPAKGDEYRDLIIKHSNQAQFESSVILFMTDATVGVLEQDRNIIKQLRKTGKQVILAVNKCDNAQRRRRAGEFKSLNLPMCLISAKNGSGIGDLLDEVVKLIKEPAQKPRDKEITIALIGKPNVGKSSILNSICGKERMIVSETPHTTRDSQDVAIDYDKTMYSVIDTAGIRRKTKQGDEVEHLSINKSIDAIKRSDVVAVIIDISKDLTSQDKRLAREVENINKGLFIVANKWDLVTEKDENTINKYKTYIDSFFPNLSWVPIIFTSAKNNKRIKDALLLAKDIKENLAREITDNALDKFMKSAVKKRKPTIGKGTRRPRLLSLKQSKAKAPEFVLEIPNKTNLARSYQQYFINSMREKFNFEGVPIKLIIKQREIKKEEQELLKHKRVSHRTRRRMVKKNMRR